MKKIIITLMMIALMIIPLAYSLEQTSSSATIVSPESIERPLNWIERIREFFTTGTIVVSEPSGTIGDCKNTATGGINVFSKKYPQTEIINVGTKCSSNSLVRVYECQDGNICSNIIKVAEAYRINSVSPRFTQWNPDKYYAYKCYDCGVSTPTQCTDSDGGKVYTTKGTVTYNGETLTDWCSSDAGGGATGSTDLTEIFCTTTGFDSELKDCADLGLGCSDGRCVTCTDTCSGLGIECGSWSVCGKTTNCGTCSEEKTCSNSKCVKQEIPPTTECSQDEVCCKFRDNPWGDYTYSCKKENECITTAGKMYVETDQDIAKLKCGGLITSTPKECYKCENDEKKFVKEVLSTELCPEGSMAKDLIKCVNNVTIPTEVILSESLTFDEWKNAPSFERVKTICKTKSDCAPYEDLYGTGKEYVTVCSGDSRVQTQFQLDIEELCKNTGAFNNYLAVGGGTAGFLTGCYLGAGLGFTAGLSVLGIGSVPGAVVGCILGGTAGTTMTVSAVKGYSAYAVISCKEKKVAPGMGACIAVPSTGQIPSSPIINTCPDLIKDFGKMFGADKYACLIGWIFTIIAGIILLMILFKILGK